MVANVLSFGRGAAVSVLHLQKGVTMIRKTENIDLVIRCEAMSQEEASGELTRYALRFLENHDAIATNPYLNLDVSKRRSVRYGYVYRAFAVWGGTAGSVSATSTRATPEDATAEALRILSYRIRSYLRSTPLANAS